MKHLLILALFYSQIGISQDIEFYAGVNTNRTFISGHTSSLILEQNRKPPSVTRSFRAGVNYHFKLAQIDMKAGLSFTDYSGEFESGQYYYDSNGPAASNIYKGSYRNQAINIDFFPLNFKFDNNLEIAIGANFSMRVHSKLSGSYRRSKGTNLLQELPLSNQLGGTINWGALLNILYVIELKNGWGLTPQLLSNLYFVQDYTDHSKWMNMFGLGIRKSLGNTE